MTENVAQEMLRILPNENRWIQDMAHYGSRRCLAAALLHIDKEQEAMGASYLNDDPYTQLLAQIITDQYPERTANCTTPIHKIVAFNDHAATTFPDVRTVLEKAAASWDEKGNHDD